MGNTCTSNNTANDFTQISENKQNMEKGENSIGSKNLDEKQKVKLYAPSSSMIYKGVPKTSVQNYEEIKFTAKSLIHESKLNFQTIDLPPLIFPSGDIYKGKWGEDQKMYGKGELQFSNGSYLIGDFIESQPKNGLIIYQNGDYYVGSFKDKKADGKGKCYFCGDRNFFSSEGFKYEGCWKNDQMHHPQSEQDEMATYTKENVFKFVGWYENGLKQGSGTLEVFDLFKYEGAFLDDEANGKGKLSFLDGTHRSYVGQFKNNKKEGFGIFLWPKLNAYYRGTYLDDKRSGQGEFKFLNGMIYNGQFMEGQMHGEGVFTTVNGFKLKAKFDKDKFIKSETQTDIPEDMRFLSAEEILFQLTTEDYEEGVQRN